MTLPRRTTDEPAPCSAAASGAEPGVLWSKAAAATTKSITPKPAAAEAITTESASTAAAIKAAALKALEPLA